MSGTPEKVISTDNGAVIEVSRGSSGVALINISGQEQNLNGLETTVPDGEYHDRPSGPFVRVYNSIFTVKSGKISGTLSPYTSYILYNN